MKTTILMLTILLTLGVKAQDKRFTAFVMTDPIATTKDGFNLGIGIEYQMTIFYFKARAFSFPELRGASYFDLYGAIGLNYHNRWNEIRIFGGVKGGNIWRDGKTPYPSYGVEAGFEYYPNGSDSGIYFGLQGSYIFRTDDKFWNSQATGYWRENGFVKIGYAF